MPGAELQNRSAPIATAEGNEDATLNRRSAIKGYKQYFPHELEYLTA